jgi:hypothetical protein
LSGLYVTNGDSTGDTLRETALGGDLCWRDALNEGPVPALPQERLREVRAGFLSECGWGSRHAIAAELERRDRLLERSLRERRHVVLWFEHDLYDQLQLLQILALVPLVDGSAEVALTDAGREVLRGEADRIDLLGIDRWVGGTHLRPGHVWRWDRSAARVVAD